MKTCTLIKKTRKRPHANAKRNKHFVTLITTRDAAGSLSLCFSSCWSRNYAILMCV